MRDPARPAHQFARIIALAILALAILALATPARADATPDPAAVVALQAARLETPLAPGATSRLIVTARVADGWHVNSDHPLGDYYVATRLTVAPPPAVTVGAIVHPTGAPSRASLRARRKALGLHRRAHVHRCPDRRTRLLQRRRRARQDRTALPGVQRRPTPAARHRHHHRRFVERDRIPGDLRLETRPPAIRPPPPPALLATPPSPLLAGVFAAHGSAIGLLFVLLAGLALLNLTPCVYPLIGVTIAYFFGNRKRRPARKVLALASLYVLGIALTFSAVGVAVALSGGLFGAALQNPWILAAIAAMLLGLAASSFGLFVLQPPQWIMRRAGVSRPGYLGALLMGSGMGVVAAPCIGPIVLGLLLMVQRSRSPLFGLVLFFTLAVGLGLPYIALALAAGSIRRLPRSGQWLEWIEQLFGFVLIGLALYFLDPIVPNRLITRALPYYGAAVGLFLGFLSPAGRQWRPFLIVRTALGLLSAAALIYLVLQSRRTVPQLTFQAFDSSPAAGRQIRSSPHSHRFQRRLVRARP